MPKIGTRAGRRSDHDALSRSISFRECLTLAIAVCIVPLMNATNRTVSFPQVKHQALKDWSGLCFAVRPRFIGPVGEHAIPGRHPDETNTSTTSTYVRAEVTCARCLVILDQIEERGIPLKWERVWYATDSKGVRRHAAKKTAFKKNSGYDEPQRGAFVNTRSLAHYLEEIRAALSISA